MANPLRFKLQDYQNALNRYRQAQRGFNKRIDDYNATLAFDAKGRTLVKEKFGDKIYAVTDDGLEKTGLPEGKTLQDFNYSSLPDSNRYLLVRQGTPLEQKTVRELDPNKNPYSSSDPYQTRVESIYPENPGRFDIAEPAPVRATVSQMKRLQQGDPLAAQRGLISEVIQSKGIR